MDEPELLPFEEVLDQIDVIYPDEGGAYMSIHTIDQMNSTIAEMVETMHNSGEHQFEEDTLNAMAWIMTMWANIHDLLDLEAAKRNIPDTAESLLDGSLAEAPDPENEETI